MRYSRRKKKHFYALKKRSSNSRKLKSFPKGLTQGLGPKMAIFPIFVWQYRPGKCALRYSGTKQPIKTRSRKGEQLRFFQRG